MGNTRKLPLLLPVLTVIVSLFMLAPIVLSVMAGLVNNYSKGLASGLTLRWITEVIDVYGSTVYASLMLATVCVAFSLVLGVPCAYALARSSSRWARLFEELLIGNNPQNTSHPGIFMARDASLKLDQLMPKLDMLIHAAKANNLNELRLALEELVHGYQPESVLDFV